MPIGDIPGSDVGDAKLAPAASGRAGGEPGPGELLRRCHSEGS